MSDLLFEQMLAEYNQGYAEAEEFSGWMPDDGNYIVTIVKVTKGVAEKSNTKLGWWKFTARIEDVANAKTHGQEFTLKFCNTKALGVLKGFARALNEGVVVSNLAEADKVFEHAEGKILDIKILTSTSKKDGKDYKNCYIQKVVDTSDVSTPPQG